jgi:hypothetical protein
MTADHFCEFWGMQALAGADWQLGASGPLHPAERCLVWELL